MERVLVFGYLNSGQKRKNEEKKNEEETILKKIKSNEIAEKPDQDQGKVVHQTGNFGKMTLPNRETVAIDRKIVKSFIQKKRNEDDLRSSQESDNDSTDDEQKTD